MKFPVDSIAPMALIPFSEFKRHGSIPSSFNAESINTIGYDQLCQSGNRASSLVVFVSHLWLSPSLDISRSHPDFDNIKYNLICRGLERLKNVLPDIQEIYLWIDFFCIDQKDLSLRSIGIGNLPGYLECCDALFTPYTDEVLLARGESTEIPTSAESDFSEQEAFSLFCRYRSLYDFTRRAWCRLEMFMGTNAPMPENGFEYFKKVNVTTRKDRPHLFYGSWQDNRDELPDPGPVITAGFFEKLHPENGLLTLESDRSIISQLVSVIDIKQEETGYKGEVGADGQPDGQGTMRYESGAVYSGQWKKGKHHGQGTFIYANGMRYVGGWDNDDRHGSGVHYLSNGLVYKGAFLHGPSHGPGKLYYANGKVKIAGTKEQANWVGHYEEYHPNGALKFKGTITDGEKEGTEYDGGGKVIKTGRWRDE